MNRVIAVVLIGIMGASLAQAGVKYANEDGDYVKLGGRLQLQYHYMDPDEGQSTDELLFRRLRPYIEGSVHKDWKGKWQFDLGKGDVAIKDAYAQYKGDALGGASALFGNAQFPFSQELLTSSKYQQLVERTFVGDHNYGAPDRQAGVQLHGSAMDDQVTWAVAAAMGAVDPDAKKLDFDTVIQIDKGDDWNEGPMVGGRVAFYPMGQFKASQGDFDGETKVAFAAAAFSWSNDDDVMNSFEETGKPDVDSVVGYELSAALRGGGFSIDAQYNLFDAELVEGAITKGIYENSETDLENYAVEGGFMVVPGELELVAGYQVQDADNYADEWTRTSVGVNYFVAKHDIKYQVTYRMGESVEGKKDHDADEVFVQAQYVF